MAAYTHAQVQELVQQLPDAKLPRAYQLLRELAEESVRPISPQRDFLCLALSERRRLLAEQAKEMVKHYEETARERQEWQGGDVLDDN
jgi:hypothetical protein